MKLIISFQSGECLMLALASVEGLTFAGSCIQISMMDGNVHYYEYNQIRSIVIA